MLLFSVLTGVILASGIPLALNGRGSLVGVIVVAAAMFTTGLLVRAVTNKSMRVAERYLATDGVTQLVVGPQALVVADTVVPYERITCLYVNVEQEVYSSGRNLGAGGKIGTNMRHKLFAEGAKSGITLAIGVDKKAVIAAPEGFINPLRALPKRGDDAGRIDVPFGAFLPVEELQPLLNAVHKATGGQMFPIKVVSGAINWALATNAPSETREKIWEESRNLDS